MTLEQLIASLPGAMSSEILTPEAKDARVQQTYEGSLPTALRQFGERAHQQNEAAFGKGMGLSTWNAYQQALNSLLQTEAVGNIRNQSQRAIDQAQQAAIGNAASYASGEQNRRQAYGMQGRALNQAQSTQNKNMLYGGLGSLVGGIGNIGTRALAPEIRSGLRGLFGYGEKTGPPPPNAPPGPGEAAAYGLEGPAEDYGESMSVPDFKLPETGQLFNQSEGLNFTPSYQLEGFNFSPEAWTYPSEDLTGLDRLFEPGWAY